VSPLGHASEHIKKKNQ